MDIKILHKEGHSIKQIARQSGRTRNTVRRILRHKEPQAFQAPPRASCLGDFKPYFKRCWEECGLLVVRLLKEIRRPCPTRGQFSALGYTTSRFHIDGESE